MLPQKYKVEILDNTLTPIAQIKAFEKISNTTASPSGTSTAAENTLEYSSLLSNHGRARFRVSTKDPILTRLGNIFDPYAYHVRISRYNQIVWEGVIIDNPKRTKEFIEVVAYTHVYLLTKLQVRHDTSPDPNYRTFNSGTMADAVRTVLTEAIADASGNSPIKLIKFGTLTNPNFPKGFQNINKVDIGGQTWVFSDNNNTTIKFDYRDIFYVLSSFANYGVCDFDLSPSTDSNGKLALTLDFSPTLGQKQPDVMFEYPGAIEDYNLPLLGSKTANHLIGVAADNNFNILKQDVTDTASVALRGKLEQVGAYADAKSSNILQGRLQQELILTATPDTEANVILNDRAYPLGQYSLGDTIRLRIRDHFISYDQLRRIIGVSVNVHVTGRETIQLNTNPPRPGQ